MAQSMMTAPLGALDCGDFPIAGHPFPRATPWSMMIGAFLGGGAPFKTTMGSLGSMGVNGMSDPLYSII